MIDTLTVQTMVGETVRSCLDCGDEFTPAKPHHGFCETCARQIIDWAWGVYGEPRALGYPWKVGKSPE